MCLVVSENEDIEYVSENVFGTKIVFLLFLRFYFSKIYLIDRFNYIHNLN